MYNMKIDGSVNWYVCSYRNIYILDYITSSALPLVPCTHSIQDVGYKCTNLGETNTVEQTGNQQPMSKNGCEHSMQGMYKISMVTD